MGGLSTEKIMPLSGVVKRVRRKIVEAMEAGDIKGLKFYKELHQVLTHKYEPLDLSVFPVCENV